MKRRRHNLVLLVACAFLAVSLLGATASKRAFWDTCALYVKSAIDEFGNTYWVAWCQGTCDSGDCTTAINGGPGQNVYWCKCNGIDSAACSGEVIITDGQLTWEECYDQGCSGVTVCDLTFMQWPAPLCECQ